MQNLLYASYLLHVNCIYLYTNEINKHDSDYDCYVHKCTTETEVGFEPQLC